MSPKFSEVTYTATTAKGNTYIVARDEQGREVAVFGQSVQKVKDTLGTDVPGDVLPNGTDNSGNTRWKWEHPEFARRSNGGGAPRRNPIQEIVGIAHWQAMELSFASRPSDMKLSEFWKSARPHIRTMAREIAEDRLTLQREVGQ